MGGECFHVSEHVPRTAPQLINSLPFLLLSTSLSLFLYPFILDSRNTLRVQNSPMPVTRGNFVSPRPVGVLVGGAGHKRGKGTTLAASVFGSDLGASGGKRRIVVRVTHGGMAQTHKGSEKASHHNIPVSGVR